MSSSKVTWPAVRDISLSSRTEVVATITQQLSAVDPHTLGKVMGLVTKQVWEFAGSIGDVEYYRAKPYDD